MRVGSQQFCGATIDFRVHVAEVASSRLARQQCRASETAGPGKVNSSIESGATEHIRYIPLRRAGTCPTVSSGLRSHFPDIGVLRTAARRGDGVGLRT